MLIGTNVCPLVAAQYTQTSVVCTLPAGEGLGNNVQITVSGQPSNIKTFNYQGPSISSVTPANGPTAGNIKLTVLGNNFGLTGNVTIANKLCVLTGAGYSHSAWLREAALIHSCIRSAH